MTALPTHAAVEASLRALAPSGAGVAACRADPSVVPALTTDEFALVRSAHAARRSEFAAGRASAHRALAEIGADTPTIGAGGRRQPLWPQGVTGSISHAGGLGTAVAVGTSPSLIAIGLDLELADGLSRELWSHVLTPMERSRCAAAANPPVAATTIFSAKEAAFKALYPLLGVEVDFLEATADLDGHGGIVESPNHSVSVSVTYCHAGPLVVAVGIIAGDARGKGLEPAPLHSGRWLD